MVDPPGRGELPSLLSTTFRRCLTLGRLYLGIGLGYSIVLTLVLSVSGESSFVSALPTVLPIFGVMGSMGGMMVFSNDRLKGVFEYLIAYGVSPRRLFANTMLASLGVMSIQVGVSVALGLGLALVQWHTIPVALWGLLVLYSVPMSYASAALACMAGMYWTVLSSPRAGMNSPMGLMPVVGIAPPVMTLVGVGVIAATYGTGAVVIVLGVAVVVVSAVTLTLLAQVGRLLRTDRLLSPI